MYFAYYMVLKCCENVVGALKHCRKMRAPPKPITPRSLLRPSKSVRQSLIGIYIYIYVYTHTGVCACVCVTRIIGLDLSVHETHAHVREALFVFSEPIAHRPDMPGNLPTGDSLSEEMVFHVPWTPSQSHFLKVEGQLPCHPLSDISDTLRFGVMVMLSNLDMCRARPLCQ